MEIKCPTCNEVLLITDEGLKTGVECSFCFQKIKFDEEEKHADLSVVDGQQLKGQTDQPEKLPPIINKPDFKIKEGEKIIFKNDIIIITNKRISVYSIDIDQFIDLPMKTITSASAASDIIEAEAPPMSGYKLLYSIITVVGAIFMLGALGSVLSDDRDPALFMICLLLGGPLFGLGFKMQSQYQVDAGEEIFLVHIHQLGIREGDELSVLCSSPEEAIDIQNAVNEAVIEST